ncbi:MAG: adenosylcobinamide-GDP ribazoletransferase [Pseudomonadota bacterium]
MRAPQSVIDSRDLFAAIGFLSRIPVPVDGPWASERGARVAWAYPLAGAVVGGLLCAIGWLGLGISASFAAAFVLAASVFVTGGLHEDGLADSADGLWGGWTAERRLAIMKDSRIGAYGVMALVLALLLRWLGITAALEAGTWWALIAVPALSRAAMVPLMALPHARPGGVSATVGRPPAATTFLALVLGALLMLPLGGVSVWMFLATGVVMLAVALVAMAKIRGQTGDILGAVQQLTEIACWTALAATLG